MKFKQAPLPFVGQKRQFLTHFEEVLNENIKSEGENWTIVDVFGGSGLLAHTAKQCKPKARVIYNDFDGYAERLKHIKETNQLRQVLYQIVRDIPTDQQLGEALKEKIIQEIKQFKGYKDLNCLSSWLLFSGQQISSFDDLFEKKFFQCLRKSDYPDAKGYLDGVEVVSQSFDKLLPQYQHQSKTLWVFDPPYLCTKQESYKQATYFDLIDFLRLIHLTRPPYIFFSSTKSEFIRFIEAMVEDKWQNWQAFEDCQRISLHSALNYQAKYEDNLVYKF